MWTPRHTCTARRGHRRGSRDDPRRVGRSSPAPSDPLPLPDAGPLTALPLSEEPLAVLLPATHPLVGRPALCLADLATARWIDAPDAAVSLSHLRAAPQSDGFGHQLTYTGTDIRGLSVLVAAGAGLIVAALSAAGDLPASRPFRSPSPASSTAPNSFTPAPPPPRPPNSSTPCGPRSDRSGAGTHHVRPAPPCSRR
ncbi:LysR substrate-binding domain-containing protein [Streptomyces sp. NPDC048516]|uniref:LysR substrate-binding domain-containing protein n=1 Tax=Streptomyces sp. NPDC048516 TaxID=3365565 RepID=UPI00371D9BA7